MASTKIPLELTAYAPDADGATLELQTTDTTVTDGSVLGKIEFKAPKEASGTDAILVGAAIEAVAEGTFAADNNATELVFKTGASEAATQKMVLTSGGSVGIAQSSPSSFDSGANKLVVGDTSVSSQGITIASDTNSIIYFADGTSGSEAYMGSVIYNHTNNNMTFRTNGFNTAMVIDSSQNVGIGTSSISSWTKLQVQGTAGAQTGAYQALHITSPTTTANEGVGIRMSAASGSHEAVGIIGMVNNASGNSGSMTFHTYNGGADIPERMRITSSGDVKLITANDTAGTSKFLTFGTTAFNRAGIKCTNAATYDGSLEFYTGNSSNFNERMRITSAGDLYFGQTSGSVTDTGTIIQANGKNFQMASVTSETITHTYNNTSNSGAKYIISFRQYNTEVGSIEVGTNSTALVPNSDYRLKENIKTLSNGLERVKKLNPVQFDWKKDGETSEGFLAHEVQEAGWNEGVTGEKDGERMQGVDYGRMTPLLVKAIQEQQTIIDDLKSRIKTLEEA